MITVQQWEPAQRRLERARKTTGRIAAIADLIKRAAADLGDLSVMDSSGMIEQLAHELGEQLDVMLDELAPVVRDYLARQGTN